MGNAVAVLESGTWWCTVLDKEENGFRWNVLVKVIYDQRGVIFQCVVWNPNSSVDTWEAVGRGDIWLEHSWIQKIVSTKRHCNDAFFFLLSIALNVRTQIVNFTQTVHVVNCVLLKGRFNGVICDDVGGGGVKLWWLLGIMKNKPFSETHDLILIQYSGVWENECVLIHSGMPS